MTTLPNIAGDMSILTASVTQVNIGPIAIEGLMSENGDFAIAVPQMVALDLVPPNRSAKQLESALGVPFQSHKLKTEINPKAINAITLDTFQSVIRALDKKGNPAASAFVDAMFGLSLHQVFADAFGIKFEAEERQRWLTERLEARHNFRPLTDQLKAHGMTDKRDYARFVWAVQAKAGMASGERDTAPAAVLSRLNILQTRAMTLMECGVKPWDVLRRL